MDSWTFEEYVECLNKGVVRIEHITTDVDLRKQFYYAGGSMRLFLLNVEEIKDRVQRDISVVDDVKKILSAAKAGQCSDRNINSLFKSRDGVFEFVSDYAKECLSLSADLSFVQEARRVLYQNPAWLGWVLELEFLFRIRKGEVRIKIRDGAEIVYPRSEIVQIRDANDIDVSKLKDGTWISPYKWNQPCFDFIYFRALGDVDVLNVTRSVQHSGKYSYMSPFLQKLGTPRATNILSLINNLFFYYVVDHDENFNIIDVEGVQIIEQYFPSFTKETNIKITNLCSE